MREKLWNSNYIKVWLANFMIFFSFMLVTPLLPIYLSETFAADKHVIGVVLSGYTLTALLVRPFSGFIVDSYPRKQVLLICFFIMFVFFAGYLLAGSLLLFAIVRTLHGAPFGATTVANSTVAIDVLPSSRRAEGIGYYGLSNNIATAISPSVAIYLYQLTHNFDLIFTISMIVAGIGLVINSTVKLEKRELIKDKKVISLDRFFLMKAWSQSLTMVCFAFSYGVLSTYIAIYGKEQLGITSGTGLFFLLMSLGLICSRLIGNKSLRNGKIVENASLGIVVSLVGYFIFAAVNNSFGYYSAAIIIGLGNGHMFPAFQTMFINLAPHTQRGTANSSLLISWDVGVGLGILIGGIVVEYFGYGASFWFSAIINLLGVMGFLFFARKLYLRDRLR
ncbi:MAG: MFS transporter [Bacteroidales bacterium]|nr:MFS transporter [Bacteroidales bacterium]